MRYYDFDKAKHLITEHPGAVSASMGMHEDWFWTAETIWTKDGGFTEAFESKVIGGINGSSWATPTLQLEFIDDTDKMLACHTDGEVTGTDPNWSYGCLSGPVQDNITPISEE